MFAQVEKCTLRKVLQLGALLFLFEFLVISTENVSAFPEKYESENLDSGVGFDLLPESNDDFDSEKEHRRESLEENPYDGWKGKWMPSHPGEPTSPPKIFPTSPNEGVDSHHDHGIPMGVKSSACDDGKTNLTVDWDHSEADFTCFGQSIDPDPNIFSDQYCELIPKYYVARHKCMSEPINYSDDIPLFGTHRPIWPVYGEYKYIPKQRWLHSLEHGGVVMLYHPCANQLEVNRLKKLVKGCIRRHIITPYGYLDESRPLALLTWGCRLTMSHVNQEKVTNFIQKHALQAPERLVFKDGDFEDQLIEKAQIVSDEQDSVLCSKLM